MNNLEYKGINIPEEIIIVEKYNADNNTPQGYVVPKGKDNILKTAMDWAHWVETHYHYDDEKRCRVQDAPDEDHPGIQHLYKNGTFKIKLYESAKGSCQGGKLSFWNCTIIAEDGKEFIIGINQNLLLNILLNSTVINGEVQGNVWLGREKNNVGVYTSEMEDFKQAQKDEEVRNIRLSSNYQPGQIIQSKTEGDSVYLGTVWKYFELEENYWNGLRLTVFKKPQKAHVLYTENNYREYQIFNLKPKRIITQNFKDINVEKCWQDIYNQYHKCDRRSDDDNSYSFWNIDGPIFDLQYSLELKDKPSWVLIDRIKEIIEKYRYSSFIKGFEIIEK